MPHALTAATRHASVPVLVLVRRYLVSIATLVTLVLFGGSGTARAETARLALIDPDAELEAAIRTALNPWQTAVLVERAPAPSNAMPASADQARRISARLRTQAVVWISRSEQGPALWMYDARQDRVMARRLDASPPFDPATAASVALIVKTLLRYSDVPPTIERVQAPPRQRWFSLGLMGGARRDTSGRGSFELRAGALATFWPSGLDGKVGGGLEVASGSGLRVDHRLFSGRWSETGLLLHARGRIDLTSKLDVGVLLGGGLDITRLAGVVVESGEQSDAIRVNPSVSVDAEVGLRPSPAVRVGARLGVGRPLRKQTYLVQGARVFEIEPLRLQGLVLLELAPF